VLHIINGRRPTRSDSAPMAGSSRKFDTPTQNVTIMLLRALNFSATAPNVGV